MLHALLPRFLRLLAIACLAATAFAVQARTILDLDVGTQPARLLDWGDFWIDESGSSSVQGAVQHAVDFQPTRLSGGYPIRKGQALWIRFTVPATPDDQRWYLRLPSPGLDAAALYTLGSDDSWTAQRAGDLLPMSSWALPHLYPVLPLSVSAAEPSRYMLRIDAADGFAAPIEFVSESHWSWEQQRVSLLYGVYFGLLAMGALLALATGLYLRDGAYLWFGLWTVTAVLAAATGVGVAGMHLWPESPSWSDASQFVLPALATVPFLLFVGHALLLRERAPRLFAGVLALAGLGLVCAVAAGVLESPWRSRLMLVAVGVAMAGTIGVSGWAWRRGHHFARNQLGALVPLFLVLPLQLAASFTPGGSLVPGAVPLLALGISLCATYLLLTLRSQERRDHRRRIAHLHEFDPTTGLVNDVVFRRRLQEMIGNARRFDHQSVVAIVDFTNFHSLREEFGRQHSIELLLRLAERLSAMLRSMDTVARLGDARFGLLVDGPVSASRAKSLCAKVIAHCITPLSGLPQGMVVRPKVALALVPLQGGNVPAMIDTLEALLRSAENDRNRVILMPPLPREDSSSFPTSGPDIRPPELRPAHQAAGVSSSVTSLLSSSAFPSTVASADQEKSRGEEPGAAPLTGTA